MKVSDVMTSPPVCVPPDISLAEVARDMDERAVGSVLVVEDGTLRGIVTDRDLAVRGMGRGLVSTTPVGDVMSRQVVTVEASDDLQTAHQTFRRTDVRRLPVLASGQVVGVLTVDDLLLDVFRRLGDLLGPVAWSVLQESREAPPGNPAPSDASSRP